MKKISLFILSLFLCGVAFAQIYSPTSPTIYGSNFNRVKPFVVLHIPSGIDSALRTNDTSAQIRIIDGKLKFYLNGKWNTVSADVQQSTNFANSNLTFTGTRSHNLNNYGMFFNNAQAVFISTAFHPVVGSASLELTTAESILAHTSPDYVLNSAVKAKQFGLEFHGLVKIMNYTGAGNQMVTINSDKSLSFQDIPSGGGAIDLSNYVTKTGADTITGLKTFGDIKLGSGANTVTLSGSNAPYDINIIAYQGVNFSIGEYFGTGAMLSRNRKATYGSLNGDIGFLANSGEVMTLSPSGLRIGNINGSTAIGGNLVLNSTSHTTKGDVTINGAWKVNAAGHLLATQDGTFDIGNVTEQNRPRFIYASHDIGAQNFKSNSSIGFRDRLTFYSPQVGMMAFEGTSNLFPAIKRSGTDIQFRLADDTDWSRIVAKEGRFKAGVSVEDNTDPQLFLKDDAQNVKSAMTHISNLKALAFWNNGFDRLVFDSLGKPTFSGIAHGLGDSAIAGIDANGRIFPIPKSSIGGGAAESSRNPLVIGNSTITNNGAGTTWTNSTPAPFNIGNSITAVNVNGVRTIPNGEVTFTNRVYSDIDLAPFGYVGSQRTGWKFGTLIGDSASVAIGTDVPVHFPTMPLLRSIVSQSVNNLEFQFFRGGTLVGTGDSLDKLDVDTSIIATKHDLTGLSSGGGGGVDLSTLPLAVLRAPYQTMSNFETKTVSFGTTEIDTHTGASNGNYVVQQSGVYEIYTNLSVNQYAGAGNRYNAAITINNESQDYTAKSFVNGTTSSSGNTIQTTRIAQLSVNDVIKTFVYVDGGGQGVEGYTHIKKIR